MRMDNNKGILQKDKKDRNKVAVALSYDQEEEVPRIVASGKGYLADKILEVAKESNVPIHTDEKLTNTLSKLELGDYIPKELYEVVAEVMLFVDKMDKIKGKVYTKEG